MRIIAVDCNYVQQEFGAAYLLIHEGKAFFVECNTNYAIPYLLEAVKKEGLEASDVLGLLVTHIHLDHAGGAGLFLQTFPNATLYAHPRAARHAIDPSKLIQSATAVYGEAFMEKMYGTILPCLKERVVELQDGDSISYQGVSFSTKHLRGHANHHLVMMEPESRTIFSGDAFGVSYPVINQKHGVVGLASTSPTDFEGEAALQSVDWICAQNPHQIALTHFGFLKGAEISLMTSQLKAHLQFSMELMEQIKRENLSQDEAVILSKDGFFALQKHRGVTLSEEELALLSVDLKVNAQGLHFAAHRPTQTK